MVLLIISVLISIFLLEIALRVTLPPPIVWKYPQEQYVYDSEIGHWLEPNQIAFTHDKTVNINSTGIRDKEYPAHAQNGIHRILALGDSQTFGNGLELVDTWPKQLEQLLNNNSRDVRYEVINSGLPGSDTWQHEIIHKRMISRYNPDTVILAFYVNDVVKSFTPVKQSIKNEHKLKTKFIYMLKRSALLLTLRTAIQSIRLSLSPSTGHMLQLELLKGSNIAPLDKRWQQVYTSLSRMKHVSDKKEIKFIVASLPRRDQINGQLPWDGYHDRLQTIASKYDFPLISMLEPLQESFAINGGELFIPWDGHNSKLANQVISRTMADFLLNSK